MAVCSVCNASVALEEGAFYSADEIRWLVSHGFGPPEELISKAVSAGLSREQVMARWKRGLAASSTTGWVLCPSCAARAAAYMPKPRMTRLADAWLTEPVAEEAEPPITPAEESPRMEGRVPLETQPVAPQRSGSPLLLILVVVAIVVALGAVVYLLFFSSRFGQPGSVTPVAVVPGEASKVPLPTKPPPTTVPSATPLPDLSGVILRLGDLPPGFEVVPEEIFVEAGVTESDLADMFRDLGEMRLHNVTGFMNTDPQSFGVVFSYLLSPLSEEDQREFDRDTAGPDNLHLLDIFAQGLPAKTEAAFIAGMDDLGDKSIGLTGVIVDESGSIRMDVVMVRRGAVVIYVEIDYTEGSPSPASLRELALILDGRLVVALGGSP